MTNAQWADLAISCGVCFCVSGCAYDGYPWVKVREVSEVTITKDADTSKCPLLYGACANSGATRCAIHVPAGADALIGHEAMHCFGYRH